MTVPLTIDLLASTATGRRPASCDVVIVGGGIIGVSTAIELAEKGLNVVLCEKAVPGCEQSGRNWGWVRQMGRDPEELPLAMRSLSLWRGMNQRIGAETGFRTTGLVYTARNTRQMAQWDGWQKLYDDHGLACERLEGKAAQDMVPGLTVPLKAALHTPSDGRAEPFWAVPRMADYAARIGVQVLQGCAVRCLDIAAGRVAGVVTEQGRIAAPAVVVAGGAWTRPFLLNHGIDFPQLRVLASVARVTGVTGPERPKPTESGIWAYRRRLDGDFSVANAVASPVPILPDTLRLLRDFAPMALSSLDEVRPRLSWDFFRDLARKRRWSGDDITPFETCRVLQPPAETALNRRTLAALSRDVPDFAGGRIVAEWTGVIDTTPDAVPVIGPIGPVPGLHVASGFSGHGFGIGPGAGELMADLVAGDRPEVDPAPFRPGRLRPGLDAAA